MIAVITLFFLVLAQNASFTLVSRARNSKSLLYHGIAAIGSNGIWLLVFRNMVANVDNYTLMCTYLVAAVLGSVGMHYIAMKYFEKPKAAPVQRPSVGRIVMYNYTTSMKYPAIITFVSNDNVVNLDVFGLAERTRAQGTSRGDEAGQWSWPVIK